MILIDENAFADVFGGQADNQIRMERYELKKGPWLLKYKYNGDIGYANANTIQQCRQRALIKCNGDDYEEIKIEPLKGWIERGDK